jgi:hypothetical protein
LKLLVLLIGLGILFAGAWGIYSPKHLVVMVRWESARGVGIAAAIRFVLGALLLLAAPELRQPELSRVLGAVALLAGAGTAFVGARVFQSLAEWWSRQPSWLACGSSAIALVFGALLIWLSAP